MTDHTINIRTIQHFMYCQRRFALLEINRDWVENMFVVKSNIMHENVHDGTHNFSDSKKIVRSGIAVYNDLPEYDIYGITDCMEFIKAEDGVAIHGLDDKYNVKLVEYKPTAPKIGEYNETDAIQLFAQKICADYVWNCNSEAYLYYSDIRRRVRLPFISEFEKYNGILKQLLNDMRLVLKQNKIPQRCKGQKCHGCSIFEVCFPKDKKYCVRDIIRSMDEGESD